MVTCRNRRSRHVTSNTHKQNLRGLQPNGKRGKCFTGNTECSYSATTTHYLYCFPPCLLRAITHHAHHKMMATTDIR